MDLGAVETDVAQLKNLQLLGQHEDLHEQPAEFREEVVSEVGDGVVVWGVVSCQEAEGSGLVGGSLDLSGGEDAGGVGIEEECEQDFGGVGFCSLIAIAGIEGFKIKLGDDVDDEACQMVGWQALFESDASFEGGFIVYGFELSADGYQYDTSTRSAESFSPTNC